MSNKNNNLLNQRLKEIQKSKEETQKNKPEVVQSIVTGKEEKPDFKKMAEELKEKQGSTRTESINEGYKKDTIYIRRDLYEAMDALCTRQGEKKDRVNAAYEMYLTSIYNDMKDK